MKSSPKAVTLLFIVDQVVADLLAFCVDAIFRKCQSLTILGGHAGTSRDDLPRFLASDLHCIGVNALQRNRIHIGVSGYEVVLAVVVTSELTINRLPFRIRAFSIELDDLSDSLLCDIFDVGQWVMFELRFCA